MPNHVKPTVEELEAQALAKAEEAEALAKAEAEKNKPPENPIETDEQRVAREEAEKKKQEEEDEKKKKESPDYKKKFIENQREAIILASKNKKLNEAIDNAGKIAEPTEAELKAEFPEWEDMSTTEQKLSKEALISKRRFALIQDANRESHDIESWHIKVDEFLIDPQTLVENPELEGKTDDFRMFAMKQSRRGIPFEDLVKAFLYDESKVPKKVGKMIEEGAGGDNAKPKPVSDKISLEQARILRKTDYNKYTELLRAGKIESVT